MGEMMGTILSEDDKENHKYSITQQCFPVFSFLLALDNPTINLFSLDIEGLEYQVNNFTISQQTPSLPGTSDNSLESG